MSSSFIFSVLTSKWNFSRTLIFFLISKQTGLVQYWKLNRSSLLSHFCLFLNWQTFICFWIDVSEWLFFMIVSRYLYIVSEIRFPFLAIKGWKFSCWHRQFLLSTKNESLSYVVLLSMICFPIVFIVNIFLRPSLLNQNCLNFSFHNIQLFQMAVWRPYLIREILILISSLIYFLALNYFLKKFKYFITFIIWLILDMLVNSWKKQRWVLSGGLLWYRLVRAWITTRV